MHKADQFDHQGTPSLQFKSDFRVSRPAEIFQFDRFSLETNFKRARNCYYGIPRLGSNL